MSRRGAVRTIECTPDDVKAMTELGYAVIKQAVRDVTKNVPAKPPVHADVFAQDRWQKAIRDRDDAHTFLTTDNPDLSFWCRVVGFDLRRVIRYAKAAASDWVGLGRAQRLHQAGHERGNPRKKRTLRTLFT